jgi:hypothetical protein
MRSPFSAATSFVTSISRSRSASNFFNRAFSLSIHAAGSGPSPQACRTDLAKRKS